VSVAADQLDDFGERRPQGAFLKKAALLKASYTSDPPGYEAA
jgi:hypothetical protein